MGEIVMPRLSDTMEEGTILRWLKRDGEQVARGEELVEIETDKATMTYESDQQGTLQTLAPEGATLAVGQVIARVGVAANGDARGGDATNGAATRDPAHADGAPRADEPAAAPASQQPPAGARSEEPDGAARVKASPLARRIARERGIELRGLSGSGPGGRIVKADVLAGRTAAMPQSQSPTTAPGGVDVTRAKGETTVLELSRSQQAVARRMAESKATIPHFTLQADVDMEECVRLRAELKRIADAQPPPTYNDMVVKACALALRAHPRGNSSYRDGRVQLFSRINVGIAVATEPEGASGGTLVVPTVFDADTKSLGEIAREARALAARVRDGSITPPELGGGTFTVSNLGMYGVRSFTAIINPPQAAILSVGAVEPVAVVREGELVARHRSSITLACDHRVLYGADAAALLAHIRELLERPTALTL